MLRTSRAMSLALERIASSKRYTATGPLVRATHSASGVGPTGPNASQTMVTPFFVRIALDGTLLHRPTTGISLYAKCLLGALRASGVDVEPWRQVDGQSASVFALSEVPRRIGIEQPDVFHAVCNFN